MAKYGDNMKYNCILDCDPGHDDAMAIMLLGKAPNLNCLGITTVSGNQTIEKGYYLISFFK